MDSFKGVSSESIDPHSPSVDVDDDVDETYKPPTPKKQKHSYVVELDDEDDPFPFEYQHPRMGLRSVRPEFYALMHYLFSSLHMSQEQVEGSIVAVANMLFGRKWKVYSNETYGTDNDTLPSMSNTRRTERYMEALALYYIVEEIMKEDTSLSIGEHVIVYWMTKKPEWGLATVDTIHDDDILDVVAFQVS